MLHDNIVAFIEREVAIDLASASADHHPSSCRGFACRVAPDRQRVTLFVRREEARQLLQDVLVQDAIAVVFCLPETEAAIQIKGRQIALSAVSADDMLDIQRYRDAFIDGIARIGHPRPFAEAYMAVEAGQMVAITFQPEAVFEQTPGPRAGQPVGQEVA
jgi:hypothetical protein